MSKIAVDFKDVSDFIVAHKKEFEIFEEDLNLVATWAKDLSKIKKDNPSTQEVKFQGSKLEYVRSYYLDDDNKKEAIQYKDETLQKNLNEIMWDFMLNHFKTIKSGNEFKLSNSDIRAQFNTLNLADKEEATIYLASLFSILFNHNFLSSINIASLERFLYDNDLIIFEIDKYHPNTIASKRYDITTSGSTYVNHYYSIKDTKNENFIHIAQLLSNLQKQKTYAERGGKHSYQRESAYKILEKNDYLEKIVPKNTLQVIKKVLNKDCELGIPYNLSNEFAMNVVFNAMPKTLKMDWYKKFKLNISRETANDKLGDAGKAFNMMYLLIKKYGYKKIKNSKYIDQGDLSKILILNFYSDIKYKKVEELDEEYTAGYINLSFNNVNSIRTNMLDMLYACVQLSKLDSKALDKMIKQTDKSFKYMISQLVENDQETIENMLKLYNAKDVKSKKTFKELKNILNKFYYKEKSIDYVAFDEKIKKQIEKDSFKYALLKRTKFITAKNHNASEQTEEYTKTNEILEEIAQTFALKI